MSNYRYDNLVFFNKKGDPIHLKLEDDGVFRGSIHLDEVSEGLHENETIFILEKFKNSNGDIIYGVPHFDQDLKSSQREIQVQITGQDKESYNLFEVDNPFNETPSIDVLGRETTLDFINSPNDTIDNEGFKVTDNNVNQALRVDVFIKSEQEGKHIASLEISDGAGIFIEVELYSEVEAEDERLGVLLNNLGEFITEDEEYIFRQSDINEDFTNWKILNRKRKELLVELRNIKPFTSGILGIVNILKFFGYFDLELKEYWKNVETGKFFLETIKLGEYDKLSDKTNIKEYPYRKTPFFGLFYDINRVVEGEFTEEGLPVTERAFQFSNEEILIKLFGLKEFIKRRSIGGIAEIVDIVGEAFYFNKYDINTWSDRASLQRLDWNIQPAFSANTNFGYIRDIRPILTEFDDCDLDREIRIDEEIHVGNHPNCFIGYFANKYMDAPNLQDQPFIPVGLPITLKNETFNLPWEDIGMTWDSTRFSNILVTWENFAHLNEYEMEWVVKRRITEEDSREFEERVRGTVDEMEEVDFILPYTGFYDVELIIYGYDNEVSRHTEEKLIEVDTREVEFAAFFRILDKRLQSWENNYLTWNELFSEWQNVIFDNGMFNISENEIQNRTFDMVNFIKLDALGLSRVRTKPPSWEDFRDDLNSWKDFDYMSWDLFVHERERPARFVVTDIRAGGELQIGEDIIEMPDDLNREEYERIAELLRDQTGDDVSTFWYTARHLDHDTGFIDAVSQLEGHSGDRFIGASGGVNIVDNNDLNTWNDIDVPWSQFPLTWENSQDAFRTQSKTNPFTMDNVQIYNRSFRVPVTVPVFLTPDNSEMAGKSTAIWTITNDLTGEVIVDKIRNLHMAVTFTQEGLYTVEVTVMDTNGNSDSIIRKGHIRVMDPQEYRYEKSQESSRLAIAV